mmetsp:Transcript_45884/g.97870  ORF Transcript_45884/g.97870 Transcript_45884/m.97870 type:complete len:133 (-) Transcript_45884:249-647(-)
MGKELQVWKTSSPDASDYLLGWEQQTSIVLRKVVYCEKYGGIGSIAMTDDQPFATFVLAMTSIGLPAQSMCDLFIGHTPLIDEAKGELSKKPEGELNIGRCRAANRDGTVLKIRVVPLLGSTPKARFPSSTF